MSNSLAITRNASFPDLRTPNSRCGLNAEIHGEPNGIYLPVTLESETNALCIRFAFNISNVHHGWTSLLRVTEIYRGEFARVIYDSETAQLEVVAGPNATLSLSPPLALAWHCLELQVDVTNQQLSVELNGIPHPTTLTCYPGTHERILWLGPYATGNDTTGSLQIDEIIIDDQPAGPINVPPQSPYADDPARWLVLYNRNLPDSATWANTYRQRRNVPYANLLAMDAPTDEFISSTEYLSIQQQVANYLDRHGLREQIIGLVVGFGMPGYVQVGAMNFAVASLLHRLEDLDTSGHNPHAQNAIPEQRLTTQTLDGDLLTARIDAPDMQTAIDRFTPLTANVDLSSNQQFQPKLYIDPYATPDSSSNWLVETQQWLQSDDRQKLRLPVENAPLGNDAHTSDFQWLDNDAFYFGFHAGHDAEDLFGNTSTQRLLAVQAYTDGTPPSLRRTTPQTWAEAALAGGYRAVAASLEINPPSLLPHARPLFESLRRGWTLAEAWYLSLPTLRYAAHLIGDPLMHIDWPQHGWDVFGPLQHMSQIDPEQPRDRLPASSRNFPLEVSQSTDTSNTVQYAVLFRDANGHATSFGVSPVLKPHEDNLLPAPLLPHYPDVHADGSWRPRIRAHRLHLLARWARPLRTCRIQNVELIAETAGQSAIFHRIVMSPRTDSVSFEISRPAQPTRFRWRLTSPDGVERLTAWSAWTSPIPSLASSPRIFGAIA